MMWSERILALALMALLSPVPLAGQAATAVDGERPRVAEFVPEALHDQTFPLSIRSMMRGSEVVGEAPTGVSWTDDSRWIYFRWRPAGGAWNDERELYRVPAQGGEPERLEEEAADSLAVLFASGDLSRDRRWRVSEVEGDLYLVNRSSLEVRRLTRLTGSASSPRFSADGSRVFYTLGGNLFALHLADGALHQLTDLRTGPAPEDDPDPQGHHAFLQEQQRELFEHIRRLDAEEARDEEALERREARGVPVTWLDSDERVGSITPDPTGTYAMVVVTRPASDARSAQIPFWVTESGYVEPREFRSSVGDQQSVPRAGLLELATGEMRWLDPVPEGNGGDDDERPVLATAFSPGWSDDGSAALLFSVTADFNHRRIHVVRPDSPELILVDELHDEAWVAGPCFTCTGFIPNSTRVYFVSEATGFAQLYAIDANGGNRASLTSGDWEVHSVDFPEDRSAFLLRTNEGSPFHQHMWRMELDGSDRTQITQGEGRFEGTLSPDGDRWAVVHSRSNRPPELFVAPSRPGSSMEQVTVSPSPEWLTFPWIQPEIVQIPAQDGVPVPARIYRPADMGAESNGAAVLFVHGAGYLQNVHEWWSNYYREYMFHHLLAARGYTVLDIDYRGSAGYGRDWRTAVYRWMGGNDLSDHVDGVDWLVANEGVDRGRIGIYGGSYGGFITLMALFTEPDVFHAGGAMRSVTDWAHYNHGYTARILNQPQDDPEAYRRSSPIYFAEGLVGDLLILAPMVDTNVHFEDGVRLVQRLIELGKENWEIALYPVENHGFVEPTSWTDEYRRIYELFERVLR